MLIKKIHIIFFLLLLISISLRAQQIIESNKVTIYINNKPPVSHPEKIDTIPPEIKLITPTVQNGVTFTVSHEKIDIFGKVQDDCLSPVVLINDKRVIPNPAGIFSLEQISLKPGDNIFKILAVDEMKNISTLTFTVSYNPVAANLVPINLKGQYYALIIAVNQYQDPDIENLDNPVRDAKAFYNVITSKYIFEPRNVMIINNPSRISVINALDKMNKRIGSEDNFLIFYAGHGFWDQNADIGYWLPTDSRLDSRANWISNSDIRDWFKIIKAKHNLLISDACFSGSIFKSRGISMMAPEGIKRMYERPSYQAMTSGAKNESVPDESVFLRYLLDRLANNSRKYLNARSLFSDIQLAVSNNSKTIPQFGVILDVGDEGGDFIFIKR